MYHDKHILMDKIIIITMGHVLHWRPTLQLED